VRVSFVGYEKTWRNVNVPARSDLGEIELSESANRLSEVVVTATRPFVEQRVDRYVVNVGSHIQTAGRDALGVLGNTPGVLVTSDGSITVMGNRVEIWIDGRPSRLSGEQLKALLTATPGETIDRIEVITNPSSRYDAAGTGGIINIRTVKGLQYGVNGSANAAYTKGKADRENAGLQLNYRNNALNLFGNYGINRNNDEQSIRQVNKIETPEGETITFDQNTLARNQSAVVRHQYRLGADFFLSPNKTLGILLNGYENGKEKIQVDGETQITPAYDGVDHTDIQSLLIKTMSGKQANINYQQTFAEPGRQFNADVDYGRFNSNSSQQFANRYYSANGEPAKDTEQSRHANPQAIDVYSVKMDYRQPLGKIQLEAGVKSSGSKTDNDLQVEQFAGQRWETDANQSNHFVYTEQIHAAYASLSRSWGKWSVQAGLRGEYTRSDGKQRTTGMENDSSYFNLFPTLYVNYRPENHTLGLSYSRRLMRPSYSSLNPFELKTDAYSYTAGNPYLTPTYIHNVQLSYAYRQSLMVRLSYNHITDLINLAPVADGDQVRYGMIPTNFGKRQSFTLMANYRISPAKWWTLNLMADAAYATNRSVESSGVFTNNGFVYDIYMNNSITLGHGFSAEITGLYVSMQKQGYLVMEPMGYLSAGVRKSLLKNKMTLSLNANDLLYTMTEKVTANYEKTDYQLTGKRDSRFATLSVRYSFGSDKVKASRNRNSGIEDEAGRAK
jgi:hypothetical protein